MFDFGRGGTGDPKVLRKPDHACWGRGHEIKVDQVVDAQALQQQHDVAKVGALQQGRQE